MILSCIIAFLLAKCDLQTRQIPNYLVALLAVVNFAVALCQAVAPAYGPMVSWPFTIPTPAWPFGLCINAFIFLVAVSIIVQLVSNRFHISLIGMGDIKLMAAWMCLCDVNALLAGIIGLGIGGLVAAVMRKSTFAAALWISAGVLGFLLLFGGTL